MYSIGRKGLGYRLLRHDGSIERCPSRSNGLGTQGTRGGRIHKTGVPRVLYAMHYGCVAVVGIGARGFALQGAHGAVWARVAAGSEYGGRLRAWRLGV